MNGNCGMTETLECVIEMDGIETHQRTIPRGKIYSSWLSDDDDKMAENGMKWNETNKKTK